MVRKDWHEQAMRHCLPVLFYVFLHLSCTCQVCLRLNLTLVTSET